MLLFSLRLLYSYLFHIGIAGLYALGDCIGCLLQISKAVYEGAKAGTEIIKYLRNNRQKISV